MKTTTTFALLVISTVLPCLAQQQEKRLPGLFGAFGPVRSVREERVAITNVNGAPVEGARVLTLTVTYNENGTKQEQTFYAPDGAIRSKRASLYDQDGRLLEDISFTGRNHDLPFKTVYHFDSQKKVIEIIVYKPDGTVLRQQSVVRQENPQTTETTIYDQNGTVVTKSTANNTPQSRTFESYIFGQDRVIKNESAVTSTPRGGQVFEKRENGKILYRYEIIPGEKGKSERIIYKDDGSIQQRESLTTEFDSHGNPVKLSRSVAEGDSTDYKLVEVTYRTIEYYE
jgi:antitoxin component YwqK of YwqJK toxin-antitoxin module